MTARDQALDAAIDAVTLDPAAMADALHAACIHDRALAAGIDAANGDPRALALAIDAGVRSSPALAAAISVLVLRRVATAHGEA